MSVSVVARPRPRSHIQYLIIIMWGKSGLKGASLAVMETQIWWKTQSCS